MCSSLLLHTSVDMERVFAWIVGERSVILFQTTMGSLQLDFVNVDGVKMTLSPAQVKMT